MSKSATRLTATVLARDWLAEALTRGQREPFAEIFDITPEMAAALLENNVDNRAMSLSNLGVLKNDLERGQWAFNGESIVVAKTGELNDGQHRLRAVVETGQIIRSVLVFGVERESRMTLDMGLHRNVADHMHFLGVQNASTAAAVTRMIIAFERGDGLNINRTRYVSISDAVARVLADPAIAESVSVGIYTYQYGRDVLSGSIAAFVHYVTSRIDPDAAKVYIEQLMIGERLKRTDAAYIVRNKLRNFESRHRDPRVALALRGWNYFRRGEPVQPHQIGEEVPFSPLER